MAPSDALLSQALALPETERARLALRLAESLDKCTDGDAEETWAKEVARRVQCLREGTATVISADEAFARVEARLAERRRG